MKLWGLAIACFFLIFFFLGRNAPSAQAEVTLTAEQEALAEEIFQDVLSPFCAGRILGDCPSGGARELKEAIRERVSTGQSRQEVMNYLFTLYGEEIRAAPPVSGFGLLAWLLPFAFLLLGMLLLFLWLKSRKDAGEEVNQVPELSEQQKARINKELYQ